MCQGLHAHLNESMHCVNSCMVDTNLSMSLPMPLQARASIELQAESVKLPDIQSLVLWVLGEGSSPRWCFVKVMALQLCYETRRQVAVRLIRKAGMFVLVMHTCKIVPVRTNHW